MKYFKALGLFLKIALREWEPKGIIPEPYRAKGRISPLFAGWIAYKVYIEGSRDRH